MKKNLIVSLLLISALILPVSGCTALKSDKQSSPAYAAGTNLVTGLGKEARSDVITNDHEAADSATGTENSSCIDNSVSQPAVCH